MYDNNMLPVISIFHSYFCALTLFTIPLMSSLGSHPYLLTSDPLKKTLKLEDIIYLSCYLKATQFQGLNRILKSNQTHQLETAPLDERTHQCKQHASLTWPTRAAKAKAMDDEIACCVALKRVRTLRQRYVLYLFIFYFWHEVLENC